VRPTPSPPCYAIERLLCLGEEIPDARQHLGRNPDPAVADMHLNLVTAPDGSHLNAPPGVGILPGIREQIHEDLFQTARVSIKANGLGRKRHREP